MSIYDELASHLAGLRLSLVMPSDLLGCQASGTARPQSVPQQAIVTGTCTDDAFPIAPFGRRTPANRNSLGVELEAVSETMPDGLEPFALRVDA